MVDTDAIYLVLLAEGCALLLIVLVIGMVVILARKRRKNRVIESLAKSISGDIRQRHDQTRAFLQAIYQLEGDNLSDAVEDIGRHEADFFNLLILSLRHCRGSQTGSLYIALGRLIDSYKCLQPRVEELGPEQLAAVQELAALRRDHAQLQNELALAQQGYANLLSELCRLLADGRPGELSQQDVLDRVAAMRADDEIDIRLETQK